MTNKTGCRQCRESKGELAVKLFLEKIGIKYIQEYRIKPSLFRFDFFLPEHEIYIEFNGIQHYRPVETFGGLDSLVKVKNNDACKKQLVAENNGKLIVLTWLHLIQGTIEVELK